jgi:hypothetical protein
MGDIKSFPILCLMNLSLWRGCVERYLETSNVKFPPCLINGDDFCAYAPEPLISLWFEMARDYNFIPSIGKSYVSEKNVTINSRLFTESWTDLRKNAEIGSNSLVEREYEMKKIHLRPINILFKTPRDVPISDSVNLLIEHDPHLHARWINYNRHTVQNMTRGGIINLNLPLALGGIGIKSTPKFVTAKQGAIARKNLYAIQNGFPELVSRPLWETKPYRKKYTQDQKQNIEFLNRHEHVHSYKTDCRGVAKDAWISSLSREFSGKVFMKLRVPFMKAILAIQGREFTWSPELIKYYDYKFEKYKDVKYKHVLQLEVTDLDNDCSGLGVVYKYYTNPVDKRRDYDILLNSLGMNDFPRPQLDFRILSEDN